MFSRNYWNQSKQKAHDCFLPHILISSTYLKKEGGWDDCGFKYFEMLHESALNEGRMKAH